MVAHCWRFHADVQALRRRVAAGELGDIVKTRGYGVHAAWGPSGWFVDPELAGGGGPGRHGRPRHRHRALPARRPRARARLRDHRHARYGDYQVDDDGILLISWSNGTNSIVESGWWQPHLAGLEADTELYGTGGYARIWDFTEGPRATSTATSRCTRRRRRSSWTPAWPADSLGRAAATARRHAGRRQAYRSAAQR